MKQKHPSADRQKPPCSECEELFHAIFNLAAIGIAQTTLDGKWLLMNQKICDILGYSPAELKSLTVLELCHPADRKALASLLRELASGAISNFSLEKRCLRKTGETVWINLNVTLVREKSGEPGYLIAVVEDIDERKTAEEELRQSEEKFSKVFNLAPIGITISTLSDGTFIGINEAGLRLSGYDRDEVIGHSASEFNIWKNADERVDAIREVLATGEIRDREMVMKDKSGRIFWGLYSGIVVEIHGEKLLLSLVSDIGERKKAEAELQESEERFRLVADTAPVLIWEAGADSRCTHFNHAWLEFTGRTMEQEMGEGWTAGVHPEDVERCLETYRSAFKERSKFSIEYRLHRSDGEYAWVLDTGVPRLNADGELVGFIGTAFDITEQKLAKEELQQANELLTHRVDERTDELRRTINTLQEEIGERALIGEALQAETSERVSVQAELREKEMLLLHQSRLAAMGEMVGNIAHQWRQPLNVLSLQAQELPMTYKKGDFSVEYLDASVKKILQTIRHMSHTIDDFRNFFMPFKEKVDFRVLANVEKTISLLEGSLKAQQVKTVVIATCDPVINGFPNEFSQVLLNIMINARDAFSTHTVDKPVITIEVGTRGKRCLVTVTDNAGGIAEEIIDRIFEPYFTTKGPEKGTGVGLFMSKTIIEKSMGGSLSVRNVGGGAQFSIEL